MHVNDGTTTYESGSGKVRVIVSRDAGKTWQAYNAVTSKWDTVIDTTNIADGTFDTTDTTRFIPTDAALTKLSSQGMTVPICNAAPFNDFTLGNGYKVIRFGYYLEISVSTDTALSDNLKYENNGQGLWKLTANFTHYEIETSNTAHTITWLTPIDGKRVKVNY